MKSKKSKRLVIDASVARRAGGQTPPTTTSKAYRNVLDVVLNTYHQIIFTEDILAEWNREQEKYARKWRVRMMARKNSILIKIVQNRALNTKILDTAKSGNKRKAMEEDLLLIEAALETDKIIISLDEKARDLFAIASGKVGEIKNVMWVDPIIDDSVIDWLKKGAPSNKKCMLGLS